MNFLFLIITVILSPTLILAESSYSLLWGQAGEKWDTKGLLNDFTNCGYKGGMVPIPNWPVSVNIKDKGAKGDGINDDTQPLRDAIAACANNGTVFLPAGRYKITGRINLTKSGVCIRGESVKSTTLYLPNSLHIIAGGECTKGNYSYDDGIITVTGSNTGFENLKIEFPDDKYRGHFQECGYNAFNYTNNVKDIWLRNIHIHNADNGFKGDASSYGTIENILFTATRPGILVHHSNSRLDIINCTGHHGLNMEDAQHWLIRGFEFKNAFIHAVSVEGSAAWNVICDGRSFDFDIDHHDPEPMKNANHNLWTNIDAGRGTRLLYGNNSKGTEMFETYWGIFSKTPWKYPDEKFQNVFVGFSSTQASKISASTYWYESLDPTKLYPRNIYLAQLAKKRGVSYASLDTVKLGIGFTPTTNLILNKSGGKSPRNQSKLNTRRTHPVSGCGEATSHGFDVEKNSVYLDGKISR